MAKTPDNRGLVGKPVAYPPRAWVQTDRASHEAWARLINTEPRAAQLMHVLCAYIGSGNTVVIAQKTLAKLMGCTERTVRNALPALVKGRWLQVVQIGHHGTVNAYRINDRVAWTESRDNMPRLSLFSAQIVADAEDQSPETMETTELRRVPLIIPPEEALPVGEGEPGAQIPLPGLEPVIEGSAPPAEAAKELSGVIRQVKELSGVLDRIEDFRAWEEARKAQQPQPPPISDDEKKR